MKKPMFQIKLAMLQFTRRPMLALLLAGSAAQSFAWPTVDECSQGSGCFTSQSGSAVSFNFNAAWDVDTQSQSGQLMLTDSLLAQGGLTLNSSTLIDYTVADTHTRSFAFDLSGTAYGQARVTVTDNGDTGDTIQIQLLDTGGVPVYDTMVQSLSSDCPGSITVGSCVVPSPCQLEVTATAATRPLGSRRCVPCKDCAILGNSGGVEFTYTIKNVGATAVLVSSLTASDSFGAIDLSTLGGGSLATGESISFTVTENVTGPFPFVNTVTVSGGAGQCSDSATVTIGQSSPPPSAECDDFVTGGGWIVGTPSGAKGNFGVHGGLKNGKLWGGLNYLDHSTGMHVKSTGVTGYSATGDTCRRITFNVNINGNSGTAVVEVCDNGEPGRDDTFSIELSNGYKAAGDLGGPRPGGGNIQLHKKKCRGNGGTGTSSGSNGHKDK
jgi:hypothetical protein